MMRLAIALSALAAVAGCAVYTPRTSELSAMSTADVCYLEYMQRPNLSAEGRAAIQSELAKRNDHCGKHVAEVKQLFADFMHRETYLKLDP